MKDLIRQILREETSGLTDVQIKAGYDLMNMITKGYKWYTDTPEQPYKRRPNSIWLINPNTKEWMFQLRKSGRLFYDYKSYYSFKRYMPIKLSDYESFIMMWVEDVVEIGVTTTRISSSLEGDSSTLFFIKNGKQLK